ncbi:MAG: NAD(P)-binding domain-containing protein [Ornithinibacter sp.]
MNTIDTVVIGAGHAGLAVSRLLSEQGREHVVIDRGQVGQRWRSERWDSLHLLTPNWMTRLPGWHVGGGDPDGFMSAAGFVDHLEGYAASFGAPVVGDTTVEDLRGHPAGGYRLATDRGSWQTRRVVIATGPHGSARLPAGLRRGSVPAEVVSANDYRSPAQLAAGGVLVVGASSSGAQIADELARAGRDVVLSVGRHTRMPRRYRGADVFTWLERTGRLARTIDDVPDPAAARREPSLQLVGRPATDDRLAMDLDLRTLQAAGVRLAGRFEGLTGRSARFRPDLEDTVTAAEVRLHRFLGAVDAHVTAAGLEGRIPPAARPARPLPGSAPTELDLLREGITTVVVAAGYRPELSWLSLPILGRDGAIEQTRGLTAAPGVYVVGQRFQHRRDSGWIHGARHDARSVVHHLLTGTPDRPARLSRKDIAA